MLSRENPKPQVSILLILGLLIVSSSGDSVEEEQVQTTGVFHDWGSTDGYNFFSSLLGIGSYLLDNKGEVLHSWIEPDGLVPSGSALITEEGTIIRPTRVPSPYFNFPPTAGGSVREYDAKGTCIWEFRYSSVLYRQFGTPVILPNGNIITLAIQNNPWYDAVKKGYTGEMDRNPDGFWSRTFVEVPRKGRENPEYDPDAEFKDGNFMNTCMTFSDELDLVWKWDVFDHSSDYLKYSKWNINLPISFDRTDYLPERDHILACCDDCGEVMIIDHSSKDSKYQDDSDEGFIYRWGNPQNYGVEGEHILVPEFASWVRDRYGWEFKNEKGSIIIYNVVDLENEDYSSVVEITPPYKEGKYQKEKDGSFGPKDVDYKISYLQKKVKVEKEGYEYGYGHGRALRYNNYGNYGYYGGNYGGNYYGNGYGNSYGNYQSSYYDYEIEWSYIQSGFLNFAQRLPNGNVLITQTDDAQVIEVEKLDRNIWEYVSPYINTLDREEPKDPDTMLGPYDEIPICDPIRGNPCNFFEAMFKYTKDFKGIKKILKA